jgi:polysaccharide biosynthesis protein PelG
MAGIGFELQKVLKGGGLASLFKVALAGIVIVAGPWLISILGIFFLNRFAGFALTEGADLFMAAIVYSYAFSLSLFGGLHYIFTRYISDLIYISKETRAVSTLILVMIIFTILAVVTSSVAVFYIHAEGISNLLLYKVSAVCLFVVINLIWLVMIFITLLKKYMTIFVVYLTGMAVSFFSVFYLGGRFQLGGALAGFTLGQLFILILLLVLILRAFKPEKLLVELKPLLGYFRKYFYLFLSCVFYSAGIWIDKLTLWVIKGETVRGSYLHLFEHYDITVYFANLTIIPGLVYFMIFSETDFYSTLRKFLMSIEKSILTKIMEEKYRLIQTMNKSLYEQSFFQGVLSLGLIIMAPSIQNIFLSGLSDLLTLRIVLAAAFFHVFYLTLLTFLFYIQMYREAFFTAILFFLINFSVTLLSAVSDLPFYGVGYLSATVISSVMAFVFLKHGVRIMDRRVYGKLL